MFKCIAIGVLVILLPTLVWLGFYFGQAIPFSEQWPLFEALRTTASIIFAVVGAWLAIIYPERLRFSFDGTKQKLSSVAMVNMGKLLHPAIHSTMILCVILLVGIIAPVLKQVPALLPHKTTLQGCSYTLLMVLTFWQIWTVILTLVPADLIKSKSDQEIAKHSATASFFSQTQQDDAKEPPQE
ncbi:hypothetical protein [Aeromonas dhakensis]|uniref:hypothetical protein n=1 Tax=Aeromonas dhakensis TaxID=196024 RepID=UPI001B3A6AB6|nr:hypothetical protein [Aeromonas dhakensis]MBQ4673295.1 hypothetical protein [Aeromonas dhakensis]